MVKMIVDAETLKLTVDDHGVVWYLNGEGMPYSSNLTDWNFLQTPLMQDTKHVRVIGSTNNAELLRLMYELKLKQELESLQVCSPMCCDTPEDRSDPAVTLFKMRSYNVAPSLGGWHEFGAKDYPSYLLAAYHRQHGASDYSRQLTYSHVAWPSASFIENINVDAFGKLLATLIDPRWFVDLADVNNVSRIEQYLGLNPRNLNAVNKEKDPRVARCKLVLDCWKHQSGITPATSIPRNFLWRVWSEKGGGARGDLAASKMFVSFIRSTWTKAVCVTPQANQLFVPKYFFTNPDEAEAFTAHCRGWGNEKKVQ